MARELADLHAMIQEVVRRHLGSDREYTVCVGSDPADDEDGIVRVLIVYPKEAGRFEAGRMLRTLTALRNHLHEQASGRIPVLSYMTSEEYEQLEARPN